MFKRLKHLWFKMWNEYVNSQQYISHGYSLYMQQLSKTERVIEMNDKQREKIENVLGREITENELDLMKVAIFGLDGLIELCGDNPDRDGLQETPFRVVKAHLEYTKGYREDPKEHLKKTFDVEHDDLILVKDIDFYSLCEHHFAPFFGKIHIAYIPNEKITGLSKFARLTDGYSKRFQVQERLTNEITQAIEDVLQPKGVMVVIEGKHMCMCGRGVQKQNANTITSAIRGVFKDNPNAKKEVLDLI